ncbi:MAG: CPBP family intramembrane metalloprotease [Cyclobacteriaceae bacterium]|nr:CPBP family intramembrane metalloprotease [Cyclobacteriaceae bacterium]
MELLGLKVPQYYPFWLDPAIDISKTDTSLLSPGFKLEGAYFILPLIAMTLLLNILAEEFYFRAWLMPKMMRYNHWSWVINGLLFGLYHIFQLWLMPVILVNSLIMAWVVYMSKSIWPALVIHLTVNFLGAGLGIMLLILG